MQSLCQGQADSSARKRGGGLFIFLCILIFFINGATGVIAKAHQLSSAPVDEASFTVISCALTALLSTLILPVACLKSKGTAVAQIATVLKPKPILSMSLIGVSAYIGSFLHLNAAGAVPASVQFPLVSGGVIVLSALISAFVFRERLSGKEWIAVAGVCASTVLFAF